MGRSAGKFAISAKASGLQTHQTHGARVGRARKGSGFAEVAPQLPFANFAANSRCQSLFGEGTEKSTRGACTSQNNSRYPRLRIQGSLQLSTTLPEFPDFISSMASLNSMYGNRCVITGEISRPLWIMAVILYQVSYISRP